MSDRTLTILLILTGIAAVFTAGIVAINL